MFGLNNAILKMHYHDAAIIQARLDRIEQLYFKAYFNAWDRFKRIEELGYDSTRIFKRFTFFFETTHYMSYNTWQERYKALLAEIETLLN